MTGFFSSLSLHLRNRSLCANAYAINHPKEMSLLFYRRPDYVAKLPGPMSLAQCQIYVERTQKHRRAIPPELSFENVIQNKALPVIIPPFLSLPLPSAIYLPIISKEKKKTTPISNPGMLKVSIALRPPRFHGLSRLRLPRRRKPPILSLAARLHQTLLCRSALRTSPFATLVRRRSSGAAVVI